MRSFNHNGTFACAPFVYPGSIVNQTGALLVTASGPWQLSNLNGGQVLRFRVNLGNFSKSDTSVKYGSLVSVPPNLQDYSCASDPVVVSGPSHNQVWACTISPGIGRNFVFVIRVC